MAGDESTAGSETMAHAKRFDQTCVKFDMVTRDGPSVPLIGARAIKPINGRVFECLESLNKSKNSKADFSDGDELRLRLSRSFSRGDRI